MTLSRAYSISAVAFVIKGLSAFGVTYLLANQLLPTQFALWSSTFSIGILLSVADLGIGQLVLTTLHEKTLAKDAERRLLSNAVAAMVLLSSALLILLATLFAFTPLLENVPARAACVALILVRLTLIPHGAVLLAHGRFHERKAIEAASYAVGALFIGWAVWADAGFAVMLLGMNAILTLGSVAVVIRAMSLDQGEIRLTDIKVGNLKTVVADSWPYFVNNIAGLAIYGGFIAFCSTILAPNETARLSVLHTIVFMHLYQVFDLVFRTAQTRLQDPALFRRLEVLTGVSFATTCLAVAALGVAFFARAFGKYPYSVVELLLYTTFAFAEIYYSLLTVRMQMNSARKKALQALGIAKAVAFALVLLAFALAAPLPSLRSLVSALIVYSVAMAAIARRIGLDAPEALSPVGKV